MSEIFLTNPLHQKVLEGDRNIMSSVPKGVIGCFALFMTPFIFGPMPMFFTRAPLTWVFALFWYGALFKMFQAVWTKVQQHKRLLEKGELLGGIITKTAIEKDSEGDPVLVLEYRFTDPSGVTRDGKKRCGKQEAPAEGTPVAVMYLDPKNYTVL